VQTTKKCNGPFRTYLIPKFVHLCSKVGSMPIGDNNRKLSTGTHAQGGVRAKQLGITPTTREAEISAAIQQLWMKLQMAGGYNPAATDHGRSSARIALIAVLEFLAVLFPDTPTLPLALQDLLQALVDLDRGTPNPLFQRSKARGRAPIPLGEDLFRAMVAAAMTKRMEAEEISREQAARDIARRLGELGYRPGRVQPGQIEDWRDKMREGDTASLAVQRYRLALQWVEAKRPIEGVKFLLGHLPSLYPTNFPKSRPA
jgi:hypothetical protein